MSLPAGELELIVQGFHDATATRYLSSTSAYTSIVSPTPLTLTQLQGRQFCTLITSSPFAMSTDTFGGPNLLSPNGLFYSIATS